MGSSVGCPHVHPMELHWGFSMGVPWMCSMGNALGSSHGHSMELHWDFSWGIPWYASMGSALGICPCGFYGMAVGLLIGKSMEV